ncbi:unnamed protein product, partial [Adineta steineri]
MPLVNYEGDSSEEEEQEDNEIQSTTRRLDLPAPSHPVSKKLIDGDDDDKDRHSMKTNIQSSSTLLSNLRKPQNISTSSTTNDSNELPETELEDIVRGDNKEYAKNVP